MDKYPSSQRFWRNERGSALPMYLVGYGLGIALGIGIGGSGKHGDDYLKEIQLHNEQIAAQLAETAHPVSHLQLDDDNHFTFDGVAADGNAEKCSGEYAVKQAAAVLSGKVTCTETVTLSN